MRNITYLDSTLNSLFSDLNRLAVGFEPTFRLLDQMKASTSQTGYPPYDLESIDENQYRLSMAVAGFTADDINITVHEGVLTIEGNSKLESPKNYLYKGIASRNFKRVFYLENWVSVTNSNLSDGILTIDFLRELPESAKPKKIEIGSNNITKIENQSVKKIA